MSSTSSPALRPASVLATSLVQLANEGHVDLALGRLSRTLTRARKLGTRDAILAQLREDCESAFVPNFGSTLFDLLQTAGVSELDVATGGA